MIFKIHSLHPLKEFWASEIYSKLFEKSLKITLKHKAKQKFGRKGLQN